MTTQQTNPDGDIYDGPVVVIDQDDYAHVGQGNYVHDLPGSDGDTDTVLVRTGQGAFTHDYTPEPAGDLVPFIVGMTYGIIIVSIVWLVCIWST